MKNLLLILLFVAFQNINAQSLVYEKVQKVDSSISAKELYKKAKLWFAYSFKDSKEVLEIQDEENGTLFGKGSIKISDDFFKRGFSTQASPSGYVSFNIKVEVKDGRYKYEFSNFYHNCTGGFGAITTDSICPLYIGMVGGKWRDKKWNELKSTIDYETNLMIGSLYLSMSKKSQVDTSKSEW